MKICKQPYMAGALAFGCGRCLPCRITNRVRKTNRQILESYCHDKNCFITLTYSDEKLPADRSLRPLDLRMFLWRLRKRTAPSRFRYFAVGEYGDENWRPHYHISLFGLSGDSVLDSRRTLTQAVEESWTDPADKISYGYSMVAEFSPATAQYVAGYTTKKLTEKGHPWLGGLHPEFSRASNRPGLGALAMKTIAETLVRSQQELTPSTVTQLQIGKKKIPLDRYLLKKLREAIGFTDEEIAEAKDTLTHAKSLELLALFSRDVGTSQVPTFRSTFQKEVMQKALQKEARFKIFTSKRTL